MCEHLKVDALSGVSLVWTTKRDSCGCFVLCFFSSKYIFLFYIILQLLELRVNTGFEPTLCHEASLLYFKMDIDKLSW